MESSHQLAPLPLFVNPPLVDLVGARATSHVGDSLGFSCRNLVLPSSPGSCGQFLDSSQSGTGSGHNAFPSAINSLLCPLPTSTRRPLGGCGSEETPPTISLHG